jgi:ABC-type polysaccharide/polyol phosphate export permease
VESIDRQQPAISTSEPPDEQRLEEAAVGQIIPSVRPLGDQDLPSAPPPKQSYRRGMLAGLRELWRHREVMYTLTERDIRVRYKQAVLGAAWALLTPIVLMVLFSIVFGAIARITPPGGVPYPIYSYVCLVPWTLFATGLGSGATSVISNAPIIRKVYSPREAFPISAVMSAAFDFLASSVVLLGMLLAFGFFPMVTWIAALGLLVMLLFLTTALTMLVAIVTAFYRDTRYGVPLILQVLLYATPVAYPLQRVTESGFHPVLKALYVYANPLTPIIDGFRRTILYGQWPELWPTLAALGITLVLTVFSYRYFKRRDALISDVV